MRNLDERMEDIRTLISEALKNCKVGVALVTPNSRASHWVSFEVGCCHGLNIRVFPVLVQEAGNNDNESQKLKMLNDEHHFKWPEEAQQLFNNMKETLDKVEVNSLREFDPPKEFLSPIDFGPKTELEFISHLYGSRPFGDRLALQDKFKSLQDFDVSPILFDPYLEEYYDAVEAARSSKPIPLATAHRLKLAERLIDESKQRVFATSFVSNDPWFNRPDRFGYVQANCRAGLRLMDKERVTRVFIFDTLEAASSVSDDLRGAMNAMQNSKVDLHWILRDPARDVLKLEGAPMIENLLIVDSRWVTRSTGEGHDGEYLIKTGTKTKQDKDVDALLNAFTSLLRESKKIPNPAPLNLLESK